MQRDRQLLAPAFRARAGGGREAFHQARLLQRRQRRVQRVLGRDGRHAIRTRTQFSRLLGAAHQQLGHHSQRRGIEVQLGGRTLAPLLDAAADRHVTARDALHAQTGQADGHLGLGEVDHGVAVRLLVAAVDQRVQRQGVLVRRRQRLLDQDSQNTCLVGIQLEFHAVQRTAPPPVSTSARVGRPRGTCPR